MSVPSNPRVLVVGSGAIGGTIAAHLRASGTAVCSLVTNQKIRQALTTSGYRLRGHTRLDHVAGAEVIATAAEAPERSFDYILLAVQPPVVEQAATETRSLLSETGQMVCFQNGLCEERVARIVGEARTMGGVIAWGASMPEPGVFDRTSSGGFTLGRLSGQLDAPLFRLGELLSSVGPVSYTSNLLGARFSKLAMNCAVSTLGTIGGCSVGKLLERAFVRRLALEIISEAARVGNAAGVRFERLATTVDLESLTLQEGEARGAIRPSLWAKHGLLVGVGVRYRRLRSSMLQAIERGRPPAVDFLNGEIVVRGERFAIDTPVNRAAQGLVWSISRAELPSSMATLRKLYDETGA